MNRMRGAFGLTLLVTAAFGCSPPPTDDAGNDAGADTMMMTEGGPDAQGDTGVSADGGVCRSIPVESLNVLGTVNGSVLSYSSDNRSTTDSTSTGLQPPAGQTVCNFRSTHQRVFSYVLRSQAALRITTTNPGTDPTFDTTLSVATTATCSTQISFCNDDDPQQQGTNRRITSLVTTDVRPAGSKVFIALGGFVGTMGERNAAGETGMFELTVTELAPAATGANCDVAGLDVVCATDSTCVGTTILGDMGTCRVNGTAAGAACNSSSMCDTGLDCDTTNDRCFQTVADGMPCQRFTDAWQRCDANSTCVNLQRGSVTGTCRANGTVAGATCATGGMCSGAGLACEPITGSEGLCLEGVASGGACRTWDTSCVTGEDCDSAAAGGTPGTCSPTGSFSGGACAGAGCTAPLVCESTNQICLNNVMSGQPCGPGDQCPTGDVCYLTNPGDRYHGICRTPGTLGGDCRTSGTACDMGTCSAATPADGRCLTEVAAGGACHIFGTDHCATGSSCVRTGSSGLMGTCLADGTGPGAACRATGTQCDGALQCSNATGGLCRTVLAAGAACDPRFGTNVCPTGQTCRATTVDTGMCATTTMEVEPNDALTATQSITLPASVAGALTRFDLDCFTAAVPANGRIFARVNAPNGFCYGGDTAQLALDLYDPAGHLLGGDLNSGSFGCPRIDGSDTTNGNFGWAASLAAGNYTVCVRNNADARGAITGGYTLDVSAQ